MLSNNTAVTIDLAGSSIMTVTPSPVFSDRIEVRYYDRAAWASFGTQLTPDQARQLAQALTAAAEDAARKKRHADSIKLKDWVDKQPNPLRRTDKPFARELEKNAPATSLEDPTRVIYEHLRKKYG